MGVLGSRRLGCPGSQIRLSDPLPFTSSSLQCFASTSQLQPQFHQGSSFVRCGVRTVGQGGHRERASFPRVLQSPLCYSQSHRGLATCNRPLHPQRLGGRLQFSYGDCPVGSPVSPSGGLDGVLGSPGRLPPGSCTPGFSPLPEVLRRGCGVSVYDPVLRPVVRSSSVHPRHGSYIFHHASPRFSPSTLSRQLAGPGLHLPGPGACEGLPPVAMSSPRGHDQSLEELFGSDSDLRLSRDDSRDFSFEGFPDPQTGPKALPSSPSVLLGPSSTCVGLEESPRHDVLHVCHSSGFASPDAISSTPSTCRWSYPPGQSACFLGRHLPQGSSVVVRRLPSSRRLLSGRPPPRSLSILRCFRSRLGCSSRRPPSVRLVVSPLLEIFYQSTRAPGYSLCHPWLPASPSGSDGSGLLRQFYSSGIPPQTRGYSFLVSQRGGSGSSPLRRSVGSPSPTVHSRSSQCPGGFSQPSVPGPRFGMDLMSSGLHRLASPVACHDRPVRDSYDPLPSSVLFSNVRSDVGGHGCDVTVLGRPTGVCLSPVRPSSSSPGEGSGVPEPGANVGSSVLASTPLVPGPSGAAGRHSSLPAQTERSSQTAPFPSLPPAAVHASVGCVSYLRRSARQAGFSNAVASQLTHCCRRSTRVNYQAKWVVYRSWCHRQGHSVSRPTVAKVADFLMFFRSTLSLSYSSIASYRSMLSGVFRFILPELSSHFVLHELLRSFRLERSLPSSRLPPWDLQVVLRFLHGPPFEPLASSSLRDLTQKVLFLVSLATARRVGELQAVARDVSLSGSDAFLSYLPEFCAKTESAVNQLPRSFCVRSLNSSVGDLPDELVLCPVRALRAYLARTSSILPRPRTLFVSPRSTARSLSKNALSFFLRDIISRAYSFSSTTSAPSSSRAHSVRGVATSWAFARNASLSSVLAAASWSSSTVFTSFYLSDVQFSSSQGFSLGPVVAAGSVV